MLLGLANLLKHTTVGKKKKLARTNLFHRESPPGNGKSTSSEDSEEVKMSAMADANYDSDEEIFPSKVAPEEEEEVQPEVCVLIRVHQTRITFVVKWLNITAQ